MRFADILIQHAYSRKQESFTYAIPSDLLLKKGEGVVVPFQSSEKAGLVMDLHDRKPGFATKEVVRKLGEETLLQEWQIEIAEWISEYYFCSKYDAISLFLPKQIFKIRKRKTAVTNKKNVQKEAAARALTEDQSKIVDEILSKKPPISLIYGVTGAGKTEIYTQLIKNCIQKGMQALVLAPEIALTPQLLKTFEAHFPRIAVIHSRVTEARRAELWREIQRGEIDVVLGSRSAVFSPFKKLGLIVMDEEHEWSYKQEQSPRYHARTVALKIAEKTGAQVVFGSATPSIESMWHARQGDYALFTLKERISGTALPKVEVVDMRDELKGGNFSLFSTSLEQKISSALAAKEQIILFLNRRGSASSTVCRDCGYSSKCPDSELPLTYHAHNFRKPLLICHHCGHLDPVPTVCPKCRSTRIRHLGLGTERVETELQKLFPLARIARADKDTMSKKDSHTELHEKLNSHEIDILIGTQMIGKGFDIAKVSLVGILMADLGLHIPDFRTTERMFQLLTQVAGRAGRRQKQGEVVLQTYNPEHPAIRFSKTHDYDGLYEQEISARGQGQFPPFTRMIKLLILEKTMELAQKKAEALKKLLADPEHQIFSAPALFAKTRDQYQWNLLIQGSNPKELVKKLSAANLTGVRIDVDPLISI
jgi:primosomal protein N' (replication factor Y)